MLVVRKGTQSDINSWMCLFPWMLWELLGSSQKYVLCACGWSFSHVRGTSTLPVEEIAGELLWKRFSIQSSPVALSQHCLWVIAFNLFLVGSLSEPAVTEQEDGQWRGISECSVSRGPVISPISPSAPPPFCVGLTTSLWSALRSEMK